MTNLASCIAFWPRFPICFLLLCRSVSIRDWSCCSCQLLKTAAARFEDKSVCISIASSLHRLVSKFIQFNDGHLLSLLIIVSGKNGMHSRFKAAVHRHAPIRSDANHFDVRCQFLSVGRSDSKSVQICQVWTFQSNRIGTDRVVSVYDIQLATRTVVQQRAVKISN